MKTDDIGSGDFGNFGMRTGGKDKSFGGELFLVNGNCMGIEKIGETAETNNAGVFVRFLVVATGGNNGAEFACSDGGEVEGELMVTKLWIGRGLGEGVGKIKCDFVRNIMRIKM